MRQAAQFTLSEGDLIVIIYKMQNNKPLLDSNGTLETRLPVLAERLATLMVEANKKVAEYKGSEKEAAINTELIFSNLHKINEL